MLYWDHDIKLSILIGEWFWKWKGISNSNGNLKMKIWISNFENMENGAFIFSLGANDPFFINFSKMRVFTYMSNFVYFTTLLFTSTWFSYQKLCLIRYTPSRGGLVLKHLLAVPELAVCLQAGSRKADQQEILSQRCWIFLASAIIICNIIHTNYRYVSLWLFLVFSGQIMIWFQLLSKVNIYWRAVKPLSNDHKKQSLSNSSLMQK